MKKIFNYFFVVLAAGLVLTACKKETPAPEPEPEPEEPEQYADYILKMNVDYYYDLGYTGMTVDYADFVTEDKEHVWDLFGYKDEAEFIAALGTLTDGLNDGAVKFVAFDAATEYIVESGSNTNGWGNWFSAAGSVVSWGDDAYFFTEGYFPDTEDMTATLGSFPGHVTADLDGQEYRIIQGFADEEITVACEFLIKVTTEAPKVELNIVDYAEGSIELPLDYNYGGYELPNLDEEAVERALGIELSSAKAYGFNMDGTMSVTAGSNFWYMMDGNLGSWGDGAALCINNDSGEAWNFCMYPADTLIGGTYEAHIAFINDNLDAYGYTLKVKITEPEIDELNFVGVDSASVTVPYDSLYNAYTLPIDSAAIAGALGLSPLDMMVYGFDPDGTQSSYSGIDFWYMKDGKVGNWGEGAAIGINKNSGYWTYCMFPDQTLIGGTYQGIVAFYNENNDAYLFKLVVNITE